MTASQIPVSLFLIACIVASYTDLRWRRVPNLLTYGTTGTIIVLSATHGPGTFLLAVGSTLAVLFAGSFIFGLGWLGGGDIKLLAAGAAAIGFPSFLHVLLYVAAVGGLIAVLYALREGRLRTTVVNVALTVVGGSNVSPAAGSSRVPYALAICAGACIYAASESFAPWFRFAH